MSLHYSSAEDKELPSSHVEDRDPMNEVQVGKGDSAHLSGAQVKAVRNVSALGISLGVLHAAFALTSAPPAGRALCRNSRVQHSPLEPGICAFILWVQ
jgi:hypothetical protein